MFRGLSYSLTYGKSFISGFTTVDALHDSFGFFKDLGGSLFLDEGD